MTMNMTRLVDRLSGLGSDKWRLYVLARDLKAKGQDIIEMTIGEPDIATPKELISVAAEAMEHGRTGYSNGRGEPNLVTALATHYTETSGRKIDADQFLCFPGAQTALYAVFLGLAEQGDEVLVGDPMYATYEGVIRASGAKMIPVPLRTEDGFRISAADIEKRITPKSRVIFLNNPHNPTGAVLSAMDIEEIGALAERHNLWIVSDEVYEELIFDGVTFTSPLMFQDLAERVVAISSISKSHAAPGFRSGWCVGPTDFIDRLLPLAETMLFGNQPFIADMTAKAVSEPSSVAPGMRRRFADRVAKLSARLEATTSLRVHPPDAGMFALIDVSATGMSGDDYAIDLLKSEGVAVMPGSSFGSAIDQWVRIALTVDDETFDEACNRIIKHSRSMPRSMVAS